MNFSDIPVRINGTNIDASWFNTIRTLLIAFFPNVFGNIASPFTIANNQSSYANITDFIFDSTIATSQIGRYEIYRKTDSSERIETGTIVAHYKPIADTFTYYRRADGDEDALNVDASLYVDPSTGQVQYKSDNMSGANYVGKFSYIISTSFKAV